MRDFRAAPLKEAQGRESGGVFYLRRNKMWCVMKATVKSTLDNEVVRFAPAAREDNFLG